jgi:hypothetical protein
MFTRTANPFYGMAQILIGVLMIAWGVSYFYEDQKLDQCFQTFNEQARIHQDRADNDTARGQQLQARANGIAKAASPAR